MIDAKARRILISLAALAPLTVVSAQSANPQHQPYAGLEIRAVKALSEQQIDDLRNGRGMGFALPAELNGYPGPIHVLEQADALALTPAQIERTRKLYDDMKAETVPLGERLIEQETELDRLFATKTVKPENLDATTAAIGKTQGALRAAHLRYHLAMVDLLTPDQVRHYAELRGYAGGHGGKGGGHGGHGSHGGKRAH